MGQSFFIDFPACCGVQYDNQCFCCTEAQSTKCLQIEEGTKAWDAAIAQNKCFDYTSGDMVVHESACQAIECCCITGVRKAWCGIKDFKPIFSIKLWGEGAGSCKGS